MDLKRSGKPFIKSSLEIKCLVSFGVALAIVILISVALFYKVTKNQVEAQNPLMGKLVSEREFLLIHIKGLAMEQSGTNVSRSTLATKDQNDFIDSMTTLSEQIGGLTERARIETRLIRAYNARIDDEDDKPRDDFERKLFEQLETPLALDSDSDDMLNTPVERVDDDGRYHYYQPLRLGRPCWNCHREIMGDSSLEFGSTLGVIQVTIPEPPAKKESARLWTQLLAGAIVTAFLGMIAFCVVIRVVVVKPLRSLRTVSEAIGRGDVSQRANLQTADEFEALGDAFNKMLKYLVGILGFSDVLGSISTLDEKQRRYVANINKSGHALLKMINNILDLAKMDAGKVEPNPVKFRIEAVVQAQCDMAKPLVDKKNLELTTSYPHETPPMRQDEARIQQILNNLLSNAIKFTPEGGSIRIEIKRILHEPFYPRVVGGALMGSESIPFLEMKVIDSGVGVAEEDRQIIFEKFRQGKSATEGNTMTREYSGSGLGLSIVKELCKLLEGEITLESQPGFGSAFTVLLPWELDAPALTESPMQSEIQEFSKRGRFV